MILVLSNKKINPSENAAGEVSFREADSVDNVLDWVEAESIERIVVPYPATGDINPFSLARRLRKAHGPPVVVAGHLRLDTQFWAERNGCEVARSVEDAIRQ